MKSVTPGAAARADAGTAGAAGGPGPAAPTADGRATRWTEHRKQRRNELLRAVRHAIADNGDGLSMEQISTLTHTSKPVLYRYFGDRAGLQTACGQWAMAKIEWSLQQAAPDTADRRTALQAMVTAFVSLASSAPALYRFCTVAVAGTRADGFFTDITALLCRTLGLESTTGHSWAWGAIGFVRFATEHWLSEADHGAAEQPEAFASQLTDWLLGSLHDGDSPGQAHAPSLRIATASTTPAK